MSKNYKDMSAEELATLSTELTKQYEQLKSKGMKLDMSRGKPGADQLDISVGMLNVISTREDCFAGKTDTRNYGLLDGLPELKALFAELLEVTPDMVIMGGNSSLNMMYDAVARAMTFGSYDGGTPWSKQEKLKFLCPCPGYDRHFAITELFDIEMICIEMDHNGPDMDAVAHYVENDPAVKGIWCVPKYSNPSGLTYSDEVVRRFAALKPASKDFRVFWDNAYMVHDIYDESDKLLNIFDACRECGSEDMIFEFCSTSKISFPGAGVSAIVSSPANVAWAKKLMTIQTIGPDKMNQLRHIKFYKDADGVRAHMRKHAEILRPKFDAVLSALEHELSGLGIASWIKPRGGYFISLDVLDGTAKTVLRLAKEAGVTMTAAGSTYPYKKDPNDRNIRIAPTFPTTAELSAAVELLCVCVRLAAVQKLLDD